MGKDELPTSDVQLSTSNAERILGGRRGKATDFTEGD
jgi:hypothetical protein